MWAEQGWNSPNSLWILVLSRIWISFCVHVINASSNGAELADVLVFYGWVTNCPTMLLLSLMVLWICGASLDGSGLGSLLHSCISFHLLMMPFREWIFSWQGNSQSGISAFSLLVSPRVSISRGPGQMLPQYFLSEAVYRLRPPIQELIAPVAMSIGLSAPKEGHPSCPCYQQSQGSRKFFLKKLCD